jgi:hypothetical protein
VAHQEGLAETTLAFGRPCMVQFLWEASDKPGGAHNDMLVMIAMHRRTGDIDIMRWLLDQGIDATWT